jgi:5-methylcytosine-specific restriction endonuclease McrA
MTWYMPTAEKRRVRRALFASQEGRCVYYSRGMTMDPRLYRRANHATLDHLTPLALGGTSALANLVLCCRFCNSFKGSDLSGIDSVTRKLTRLFHPRHHKWAWHFRYEGPVY